MPSRRKSPEIQEEPFWWAAHVNTLVHKGQHVQAIKVLDQLLDKNIDRDYVLIYKVRLLRQLGRVKEAIAWACLEAELRPDDPRIIALKDEMMAIYPYSLFETHRSSVDILTPFRKSDSEWADVAGMQEIKIQLYNDVILPVRHPEKFRRFKIGIPNGILFYGPPGCGKTFLARNLAQKISYNFIEIKASTLGSPYIHQTSTGIRKAFEEAAGKSPIILFLDEIDAIAPERDLLGGSSYRVEEVNELLVQVDKCNERGILVIAACNKLDRIDAALRRPGRFDRQIYVGSPDAASRHELFQFYLRGRPHSAGIDFDELVNRTDGYSNADLEKVVIEAAKIAVREDSPQITFRHLDAALVVVPSSLPPPPKRSTRKIGFSEGKNKMIVAQQKPDPT